MYEEKWRLIWNTVWLAQCWEHIVMLIFRKVALGIEFIQFYTNQH